jgi:transcriptional regulator with XRE-family HTH domain
MHLMTNFAQQLEASGISKSELARRLNVDKAQITRWTKWGMPIPSSRIAAVSEITGISLSDLKGPFVTQDGAKLARTRAHAHEDAA